MPLNALKSLSVFVLVAFAGLTGTAEAGCTIKKVAGAEKSIPVKGLNQSLLDRVIVERVNAERCRRGLPALTPTSGLRKQATRHSAWMARSQKLSHKANGTNRRSLTDRLRASGVRFRTGAENIGMVHLYGIDGRNFMIRSSEQCSFTTRDGRQIGRHSYNSLAKLVVRKWMESPGHRKNILARKMRYSGVGAGVQPRSGYCGAVFLTHIFAG
ncbi:CAP domain-containing protein [uncultured Aliiroseovarius sp.]|uniref:CAP domain-containing protein n=1 Tax=uncultured Aliiroseovarius sp. TaxID=1658783 RepID=UPI002631E04D|nr:CAP domain-containing protein [uncultured Aliiroseovarius sp.]